MSIKKINENWTALGDADPYWVVLTDPTKKGNRWEEDEFFQTGRNEIESVFERLRSAGISVATGRALDFGCGVGRLSQALAARFEFIDGVDVSDSMIKKAGELNKFPQKAAFHVNVREDLSAFGSGQYDFICSLIALQHIPTKLQASYIADFMRLLKPGGVAFFQTIHFKSWRRLIPDFAVDSYRRLKHQGKPFIPMYGISPDRVRRIITNGHGNIEKHEGAPYSGYENRLATDVFMVRKI